MITISKIRRLIADVERDRNKNLTHIQRIALIVYGFSIVARRKIRHGVKKMAYRVYTRL